MKSDAMTKILLALIAVALWTMILGSWLRPQPVAAQAPTPLTCSGNLEGDSAHGSPQHGYALKFSCK
jgi:hypothetical protein